MEQYKEQLYRREQVIDDNVATWKGLVSESDLPDPTKKTINVLLDEYGKIVGLHDQSAQFDALNGKLYVNFFVVQQADHPLLVQLKIAIGQLHRKLLEL